MGKNYLGWDDL